MKKNVKKKKRRENGEVRKSDEKDKEKIRERGKMSKEISKHKD